MEMEAALKVFIVSVVQGLTEWIPISSSAQIIFSSTILGFKTQQIFLLIVLGHFGTLLSSIWFFRDKIYSILNLILRGEGDVETRKLLVFLVVSTLFSGLTGLPLYLFLKLFLFSLKSEYVSLLSGLLLVVNGC